MKHLQGIVLLTLLCLVAGMPVSSVAAGSVDKFVKVRVLADASVQVGGRPSTLSQLDARLSHAQQDHQVVMYFRDNPNQDPPPAVDQASHAVIKLVIKYRLPICFATDATLSACRKMDGGGQ